MSVWEKKSSESKELNIKVAGKDVKVMMQGGFFGRKSATPVHRHNYTELHFAKYGECECIIDNKRVAFNTGEVIAIPGKTFHQFVSNEHNLRHCAFQVNIPIEKYKKLQISASVLDNLLFEIDEYKKTGKCVSLAAYLGVVCSYLIEESDFKATDIKDREFLIHEFFDINYSRDITLDDLAKELSLSKKQAERIVQQSTGRTFRQELKKRRMDAAKQLLVSGNTTMSEIAKMVGYKTYSGFWKAYIGK